MTVHRLSAQKALSLPDFAPMLTHEQAEKDLLFGRHDQHASVSRKIHDQFGCAATHEHVGELVRPAFWEKGGRASGFSPEHGPQTQA